MGVFRSDRVSLWDGNLCIETLRAMTHARRLAKPGADCFTWGPSDVRVDLEAHPLHLCRTVDDCRRHVLNLLYFL
jgi:hypothetical protein